MPTLPAWIKPVPPALNLIAGDQPTTCPYDGARLNWIGNGTDAFGVGYRVEECRKCANFYHVYEPENDDG